MATYYIPNSSGWQANGGGTYSSYLRIRVDTSYNVSTNITTATVSLEAYNNTFSVEWSVLSGGTLTGNGATLYTFETPTAARTHHYTSGADTVFRQITSISNPSSWSFNVQHSDDGAAAITVGVNVKLYNYSRSLNSYFTNLSGTIYLNEPRASDVSASNGYFGDAIPVAVTRKSTAFTHSVQVACLGRTDTVATGSTASSLSWTPPVATYAPLLTNGMSTTATIYCTTYNGSTAIGTKTATITVSLRAADVEPSLSLTVEDATTSPKDNTKTCLEYYGAFVATKSKFKVTTNPTLRYGASVSTTSITANGATYNSSPATTDPIVSAAMTAISGSITDSRQQSASASLTATVLSYEAPKINSMAVHRCQQDGTLDDTGAYCRIDYDVSISALNNLNGKTLTPGIKRRTDQNYTDSSAITLSDYSVTGYAVLAANTDYSFDVRLVLTDDFSSTVVVMQLSTAYVRPLNFASGGLGIGIGKVAEHQKTVDIAADWSLEMDGENIFSKIYPVGSIYMSVNSTDPGTLFGGTWQRVQDRFLLAAGTTYTAGTTGGEAEHQLTANEMPTHAHGFGAGTTAGEASGFGLTQIASFVDRVMVSGRNTNTGNAGGGAAHNNMPPYLAVYVWQRTA